VDERASTARAQGSPADPAASSTRLAAWAILVALMIVLAYASSGGGGSNSQVLYHWSTAVGGFVQDAVLLAIAVAIAGRDRLLLGLRRPRSWRRALLYAVATLVAIYVWEGIWTALVHPGNEQGLTPSHWESARWAPYLVNGIVICTWIPFVEELTFRGLGYGLLERFGRWPAIVAVGVVFGLAHGLKLDLPVIVAFGCALAWIRAQTRSVVPGMLLHGAFNLIALVAVVAKG
jgi:membrane protease YdiL (CAAX protease family)